MAQKVKFLPLGTEVVGEGGSKILSLALDHGIPIVYGCASCRCGTCGVKMVLLRESADSHQRHDKIGRQPLEQRAEETDIGKPEFGFKDHLEPMKSKEKDLLSRLRLPLDGSVRLACQARLLGAEKSPKGRTENSILGIDLEFQDAYEADVSDLDEDG